MGYNEWILDTFATIIVEARRISKNAFGPHSGCDGKACGTGLPEWQNQHNRGLPNLRVCFGKLASRVAVTDDACIMVIARSHPAVRYSFRLSRCFTTSNFLGRTSKVYPSAAGAVNAVRSSNTLLVGGFGLCGLPNTLLNALASRKGDIGNLTAVSNNAGAGGSSSGLGKLLETGQLSKVIMSYIGT